MKLDDLPCHRAWNRDRRLVGLQLHQPLILLHGIPFLNENFQDVRGIDAITERGELYFSCHRNVESGVGKTEDL
jgi:hypothetical protein